MKARKGFDLDLADGLQNEQLISSILSADSKIEVKMDEQAHLTGNVAIEYMCRGQPSGISTTQADYWVITLAGLDTHLFIKTTRLKEVARSVWKERGAVAGGDDLQSRLILIPIHKLFRKEDYERTPPDG